MLNAVRGYEKIFLAIIVLLLATNLVTLSALARAKTRINVLSAALKLLLLFDDSLVQSSVDSSEVAKANTKPQG